MSSRVSGVEKWPQNGQCDDWPVEVVGKANADHRLLEQHARQSTCVIAFKLQRLPTAPSQRTRVFSLPCTVSATSILYIIRHHTIWPDSTQLNSIQLNSTQLNSTQLKWHRALWSLSWYGDVITLNTQLDKKVACLPSVVVMDLEHSVYSLTYMCYVTTDKSSDLGCS